MLVQAMYFQKKINVDVKMSILIYETCKKVINFNLKFKKTGCDVFFINQ